MFTFLSKNLEYTPTRHRKCKYNQKRVFFNQTGVFIIVFYCSTNFCFNYNVVFVITFYFCSRLFIALVARNVLTLKLLCSFEDVTEFAHHLIRRQKYSTIPLNTITEQSTYTTSFFVISFWSHISTVTVMNS